MGKQEVSEQSQSHENKYVREVKEEKKDIVGDKQGVEINKSF